MAYPYSPTKNHKKISPDHIFPRKEIRPKTTFLGEDPGSCRHGGLSGGEQGDFFDRIFLGGFVAHRCPKFPDGSHPVVLNHGLGAGISTFHWDHGMGVFSMNGGWLINRGVFHKPPINNRRRMVDGVPVYHRPKAIFDRKDILLLVGGLEHQFYFPRNIGNV